MAISFVGSKTFTHAATSAQSCSLTDLKDTAGANATLLEGDIVIINYGLGSTVDRTNAQMTPAGYTEASATNLYQNDSNDANQLVSYKVMGPSPDTTVSIPASNATTAGCAVAIHAFRGVNPTTPIDVAPTTAGAINTGIANAPSITPSSEGAWILACAVAGVAAGAVFTNPSGMSATTNHFRSATITTTTNDCNVATALKTDWASGAFDPAAFGGSTSTNTGSWTAVTIALRPLLDPITADATPSLETLLSTSAAKALVEGIGSGTLNAFTSSATATVSNPAIHADAAPTLGAFTATATAKAVIEAVASPPLSAFISTAASKALIEGLGSGILNAFASTSAAKVHVKADAGLMIGAFIATAAARARVRAIAAPDLGNFTSAGQIALTARLNGSPAIGAFAVEAVAAVRVSAVGAPVMAAFISEAAAKALVEGAGSGLLNAFTADARLSPRIGAAASPALDPFTAEAIGALRITAAAAPFMDAFQSEGWIGMPGAIELSGGMGLEAFVIEALAVVRIAAAAEITLGLFTSGSTKVLCCPPSRSLLVKRPPRTAAGAPRPSRSIVPNLPPRRAAG